MIHRLLVAVAGIALSFSAFAVDASAANTDRVQFNAGAGLYFAYRAAGWGVCNNTQFVQLQGSPENKQIFISQVLAAHMAGKKLSFGGHCTNPNGYLDAMYVVVH